MQNVIPLSQQLGYFIEYQSKLAALARSSHAQSIISDSLYYINHAQYILNSRSNDFILNYYINPLLYKTQTADQFSDRLIGIFQTTVMVSNIAKP